MSVINSQQDQQVNLQIVEGADGISEFGEHRDDLFDRVADATPFLSRLWASTFVREARIRGTPVFVLAWCGTKLVVLLPLAVRRCLDAKIAVPIGTGQWAWGNMLGGVYFILWHLARIKWLRPLYNHAERILYRFKQETANV
ncbi:MAG TPA: hypothetical protein DIU00_20385 [Phycisphaerales bacterium]|nr:hypothetical protein [Phycisphaerales bacterium]